MDERKLKRMLARVGDLPAMPEVVSQVLSRVEDPTSTMTEVSEEVQRDPALTAKILRISNSPFYGMKRYVGTLKLALVILGVQEVRNIVLGISVFKTLADERCEGQFVQELWGHSVMTGALARRLGSQLSLGLQGEDFIAGLLHDIGKLVLCRQLGDEYVGICRETSGQPSALYKVEEKELGFSHADVAACLASRWNLPQTLTDALRLHHGEPRSQLLRRAKDPRLAALVRIANLAAHDEWSPDAIEDLACASCLDEEAWQLLAPTQCRDTRSRLHLLDSFVTELKGAPIPAYA